MIKWEFNDGNSTECPVDENATVEVELRDRSLHRRRAGDCRWFINFSLDDIIRYRVVSEQKQEIKPEVNSGKTLRDEFAIAALSALLTDTTSKSTINGFAQNAYLYADAMMNERKIRYDLKGGAE